MIGDEQGHDDGEPRAHQARSTGPPAKDDALSRLARDTVYTVRAAEPSDLTAVRAFMLGIFERDYGYGYRPEWHWDYADLRGAYLDNPRHALFVVVDPATAEIVGTAGVRSGGPRSGTSPRWLVARYDGEPFARERTAQLVRVFTHPQRRRQGIARALVDTARAFIRDVRGYDVICLHTSNAIDFWRTMPTVEILDERTPEHPDASVHFELRMR